MGVKFNENLISSWIYPKAAVLAEWQLLTFRHAKLQSVLLPSPICTFAGADNMTVLYLQVSTGKIERKGEKNYLLIKMKLINTMNEI